MTLLISTTKEVSDIIRGIEKLCESLTLTNRQKEALDRAENVLLEIGVQQDRKSMGTAS